MTESPTPSPEELERISTPAFARKAPRFGRFIGTGFLSGAIVGAVLAWVLPTTGAGYKAVAAMLMAIGIGLMGALIAALFAVGADRPARHATPDESGGKP